MDVIETAYGTAHLHLEPVDEARAVLVLGHSASGGVDDPALRAAVRGAAAAGVASALLELPYRVAGGRPPRTAVADASWLAIVEQVRQHHPDLPMVGGGRSYGGRIACRTAAATGSIGVLCLAFPLQPSYGRPSASRLPELDGVTVPTLVVQGDRDPFGIPPEAPGREVVVVPGDHSLRASLPVVVDTVTRWLAGLLGS